MRVDKLTLSALEATLRLYLDPERALKEIPVLSMLTASLAEIGARAEAVVTKLRAAGIEAKLADSNASVGGGAFPTAAIPSCAIVLSRKAQEVEKKLRIGEPAVIGRMSDGSLLLDLRSVLPREDELLAEAIIRLTQ
jgi:L-seryl-tRNA(Ser) seleniumtransferase